MIYLFDVLKIREGFKFVIQIWTGGKQFSQE